MLATIPAGGQGIRLYALIKKIAKPIMYYGGKYRIIDFPLNNRTNPNISVVGVLTQYESVSLNSYVAAERHQGLDVKGSSVYILPPREKDGATSDVYRGTANVILQNIDLIDSHNPEYALILLEDHTYKIDCSKMFSHHRACSADAMVVVLPVPMREASCFGIMNMDETGRAVELEEKPEHPESSPASMGIHVFNWKQLRKMLVAGMDDPDSNHDFGGDIVPATFVGNKRLYAWKFKSYWKDVGTVDSLQEANMDLLSKDNELDLSDPNWKIYTEGVATIPYYIGPNGEVNNVCINQGCVIDGEINNSALFTDVEASKNARVSDPISLPDAEVGEGAVVHRAIITQDVKTDAGAVVGDPNNEEVGLISKRVRGE